MLFWPCTQLHNDNQWSQGHVLVIATQEPHKHNLKFKVHIDRKHLCKRHVKITGIFLILRHFSFFLKKLNRLSCKEKLNIVFLFYNHLNSQAIVLLIIISDVCCRKHLVCSGEDWTVGNFYSLILCPKMVASWSSAACNPQLWQYCFNCECPQS